MNPSTAKEYRRLRSLGWQAHAALRAAMATEEFHQAETDCRCEPWRGSGRRLDYNCSCGRAERGDVRLLTMPDDDTSLADILGNGATDHQADRITRIYERDGAVGIVGQYFDGERWQDVDSVWGFLAGDEIDSGYDSDVKRTTLDAARACVAEFEAGLTYA